MEKVKRGRPKIVDKDNAVCRICQGILKQHTAIVKVLRLASICLNHQVERMRLVLYGANLRIIIEDSLSELQLLFYLQHVAPSFKAQFPERQPPKSQNPENLIVGKGKNPISDKSLKFENCQKIDLLTGDQVNVLLKCNVDDLDILQGAAVKIVISYPSGEIKSINKLDAESQCC